MSPAFLVLGRFFGMFLEVFLEVLIDLGAQAAEDIQGEADDHDVHADVENGGGDELDVAKDRQPELEMAVWNTWPPSSSGATPEAAAVARPMPSSAPALTGVASRSSKRPPAR